MMKRNIALSCGLLASMLLVLSGCKGLSEPPTPPDNANDKGHEDAAKVTITFTPGTLTDEALKDPIYADAFTPQAGGVPVVFTQTQEPGKEVTSSGEVTLQPEVWYKIQIDMYNLSGAHINGQYIQNEEQRNMHQFFFMPYSYDGGKYSRLTDKPVDYRYGDKFKDGSLIQPPVGFTGYIRFSSAMPKSSFLRVLLVHVVPPQRKTDKHGNPYPFHSPSITLMGVRDLDPYVPIRLAD